MATASRQIITEILDEVFDENLNGFIGRKGLANLRNTVLERMEEAGLVDAPSEDADDDLDDEDGYNDWDDEDEFSGSSFFDDDDEYEDKE